LSTHYRQQFNFTFESLNAAKGAIERYKNLIRRLQDNVNGKGSDGKTDLLIQHVKQRFSDAMNDDLNVSIALAALFDFIREINNMLDADLISTEEAEKVKNVLLQFNSVLGIIINSAKPETPLSSDIDVLVQKRETARRAKNWKEADIIRDQLNNLGIIVEDTAQGVRWHKK
jgi:cysteinyl-tRNA synthetase